MDDREQRATQLFSAGRLDESEKLCSDLRTPYSRNLLCMISLQRGDHEKALRFATDAIAGDPGNAAYLNNLGEVHRAAGRWEEAVKAYGQALRLRPDYATTWNNLGIVLMRAGASEKAVEALGAAVHIKPDFLNAWKNLTRAHLEAQQFDAAKQSLDRVMQLEPGEAMFVSGVAGRLKELNRHEDAIALYRRAMEIESSPGRAIDLVECLRLTNRMDEGIALLELELRKQPEDAGVLAEMGVILSDLGRVEESLAHLDRAIMLKPEERKFHFNRGWTLMLAGLIDEGAEEMRRCPAKIDERKFSCPVWNGEPLSGRRILLHTVYGLGDAIQNLRFVPMLAGRGARVILECRPELKRLVGSLRGVIEIVEIGAKCDADFHCEIFDLPAMFGTTLETIPREVPYLTADVHDVERWREILAKMPGKKVGLVWSGNFKHPNNVRRRFTLGEFMPAFRVPDVQWVSLQQGPAAEELREIEGKVSIYHAAPKLDDLAETAALIAALDLVISVDTSVLHLAGAMGVKCWAMLSFAADFRWMLSRQDSPWYPTMRLLRQSRPGDWADVVADVAASLAVH